MRSRYQRVGILTVTDGCVFWRTDHAAQTCDGRSQLIRPAANRPRRILTEVHLCVDLDFYC
jgi:hypothetical protein